MQHPAAEIAIECRDVTVRYGAVKALDEVSVRLAEGCVHAIVGQNGAGKTTFARICAGVLHPASGSVSIAGRPIDGGVRCARSAGVELVHQSFALPASFTIAEALEFGSTRRSGHVFSRRSLHARWRDHLREMGIAAAPDIRIGDLPIETQQAVEIARALAGDARVLILDEPTAVLSPPSIELLFERLRRLSNIGVTVVLILHKVQEVLRIAETITVLRSGRLVAGPTPRAELDTAALACAIMGTAPETERVPDTPHRPPTRRTTSVNATRTVYRPEPASCVLQMADARTGRAFEDHALNGLSLSVESGRIVGIAGVEGNGQRTLVSALAGLTPLDSGKIRLGGEDVGATSPLERRAAGLRIIPFERNVEGLSLGTSLWENWSVNRLLSRPLLRAVASAALRSSCRATLRQWSLHFSSVDQHAGSLSGGNAQKLVLAREIGDGASFIVAAQPGRGLDVGATAFVRASLRSAVELGAGVLLISADLDELFEMCDRILVILSGRIAGEFVPPYHLDAMGKAMTGAAA